MFKYYRNAIIYPSLILLVIVIALSMVEGYDYKSEWITPDIVIFWNIISVCLLLVANVILALPMLLNQYAFVKNDLLFSFVAWFFLPLCYAFFIVIFLITKHPQLDFLLVVFLFAVFPQTIVLGFTFDRFRDKLHEHRMI